MKTPEILFEDNHLLVLYKPPGWLVQGDQTGDRTLTDWGKSHLKAKYSKPGAVFLHPAHRIDRPVSGVVLFARTDKALSRLTRMFHDQKITKTYLALVLAKPPLKASRLRHFLLKNSNNNTVEAQILPFAGAKESITDYEYLCTAGSHYLLEINPLSGRPHQIRVQLAKTGCIILGDLKYGAPSPLPDASIGLHCFKMKCLHPVRQEPMLFQAPLPDSSWWKEVPQKWRL